MRAQRAVLGVQAEAVACGSGWMAGGGLRGIRGRADLGPRVGGLLRAQRMRQRRRERQRPDREQREPGHQAEATAQGVHGGDSMRHAHNAA